MKLHARRIHWVLLIMGCLGAAMAGCPTTVTTPLSVQPIVINFGSESAKQSISIYNGASVAQSWSIEENVPWLTPSQTSGTTGSIETSRVYLNADRTGLTPGSYTGTVNVVTPSGTQPVAVALTALGSPVIDVSPTVVNIIAAQETGQFTISNDGDGILTWSIGFYDVDDTTTAVSLPDAITFSSVGATLLQGEASTVTITVDRSALDEGTYSFIARVSSILGDTDVRVNIVQGDAPAIGVDVTTLDFGTDKTVLEFNVYNAGPSGTTLDFTVSSDLQYTTESPDLISFDPASGSSQGTNNLETYVDPVTISVVVFRDQMTGATDGGTITISADGLDPVNILVNVEAAPLSFEGAINRSRPPFIMRFVFLMRDQLGNAIDTLDETIFNGLKDAFTVYEDEKLIDTTETNVFVTSAQDLRYSIALMLDYTGSMYEAMKEFNPDSSDALQELYAGGSTNPDDGLVAGFLDSVPDAYSTALMEYHERQQQDRLIHGFASGTAGRDSIKAAMDELYVPAAEHGASEVFDAIVDACERIDARDAGFLALNDADVRALIFITDGRDTSSINSKEDTIDLATELRVRLYPIGFGSNVNSAVLQELATETGGHYYAAPDLATLQSLLVGDTGGDGGLIITELKRQLVLTYNTLFQEGSHTYLINASYGGAEGSFQKDAVFATGGDVRAGQISLWTDGIFKPEGEDRGRAEIYVRTDYVPRNITQFRFRIYDETGAARTTKIERISGGLIDDANWHQFPDVETTNPIPGSSVLYFLTEENNPLQFSTFGSLLKITIDGYPLPGDADYVADAQFSLLFRVDNRLYINPPYTKFFQYPDELKVTYQPAHASEQPLSISSGFDPDATGAWNSDGDGADDFDDRRPDDSKQE